MRFMFGKTSLASSFLFFHSQRFWSNADEHADVDVYRADATLQYFCEATVVKIAYIGVLNNDSVEANNVMYQKL